MKQNSFGKVIQAAAQQKNVPASLLTRNLETASIISKLVKDPEAESRRRYNDRNGPDQSILGSISTDTSSKIRDAKNFIQLLPDVKMSLEILKNSTLSPKDMLETSLTFSSECDSLPPEIISALNLQIAESLDRDYKIREQLPKYLWDILGITGSWITAVLPENTLDEIINRGRKIGVESFKELDNDSYYSPIGLLGKGLYSSTYSRATPINKRKPVFESLLETPIVETPDRVVTFKDFGAMPITVSDNPNVLRVPEARRLATAMRVSSITGFGKALEGQVIDLYSRSNERITDKFYKDAKHGYQTMAVFKTQSQLDRRSAGAPLILHLPSESVIPTFESGDPSQHTGYFVLLDENCNPLSAASPDDYYGELRTSLSTAKDANSTNVQRMVNQYATNGYTTRNQIDALVESFTDMLEADLLERLKNGLAGGEVKLQKRDSIFRLMLNRTLKQQNTQILYLPKELVNYQAIDYNEYGVGKSLLEDGRVLLGMRVVTRFANLMAGIRNSIGRTKVNIKFDEYDADPWATAETIMHEINRTRSGIGGVLPIGASGPAEIVEYLSAAAYEFGFEGHPSIPDLTIDFSEEATNYTKVDSDLEDSLKNDTAVMLSVPAEMVDSYLSPEFATVATNSNINLSKRVMQIQNSWEPSLTDLAKKYVVNDEEIVKQIREQIEKALPRITDRLIAKQEYPALTNRTQLTPEFKRALVNTLVNDYIDGLWANLPRPNSVAIENQMEALEQYGKILDSMLDQFFDSAFTNSDTMGELGDKVDIIKAATKAYYMRQFAAENNILPEIFEMVALDENGKINRDLYESVSEHINVMTKAVARLVKHIKPYKDASTAWAEAMDEDETENTGSSDSGSDSSSEEDTGDDFGFGSDDNFDMGDFGDEDTSSGEEDTSGEASEPNEE